MRRRRGTAVAITLLFAALAAAGCGLGPGPDVGSVELTVTREFGREQVLRRSLEAKESDTVMRATEGSADVQTRFGGGFVHSINGVAEGERGGDPYDWFFFVDGVESPVGAADVSLKGDERVWWDYRNWSATNHVPAVVGSWPAPFAAGVEGKRYSVRLECLGAPSTCHAAGLALEGAGADVSLVAVPTLGQGEGRSVATHGPVIRVLVGPWDHLRQDPAAQLVESGPAESGIYGEFKGNDLVALDEDGNQTHDFGPAAGLVAATSRYGGPPIWLVTGGTTAAVREAADALDEQHLRDHYAVAIEHGQATPLPDVAP
jgi:hypothetical protein